MIKREKPCNKGTRTAEGILDVCQTSAKLIIPTTESKELLKIIGGVAIAQQQSAFHE